MQKDLNFKDILSDITKKTVINSTDGLLLVNSESQTLQYAEVQEVLECCDACLPTPSDVSFIMI